MSPLRREYSCTRWRSIKIKWSFREDYDNGVFDIMWCQGITEIFSPCCFYVPVNRTQQIESTDVEAIEWNGWNYRVKNIAEAAVDSCMKLFSKQFNLHWASVCVRRVYNNEKWSFRFALSWIKLKSLNFQRKWMWSPFVNNGVYIRNKVKQISSFVHATIKISVACEILRSLH